MGARGDSRGPSLSGPNYLSSFSKPNNMENCERIDPESLNLMKTELARHVHLS